MSDPQRWELLVCAPFGAAVVATLACRDYRDRCRGEDEEGGES